VTAKCGAAAAARISAVEFDVYWLSPSEMEQRVVDAGFSTVFSAGRPAEDGEGQPQGYLIARRR
jgi:hypothetical protein